MKKIRFILVLFFQFLSTASNQPQKATLVFEDGSREDYDTRQLKYISGTLKNLLEDSIEDDAIIALNMIERRIFEYIFKNSPLEEISDDDLIKMANAANFLDDPKSIAIILSELYHRLHPDVIDEMKIEHLKGKIIEALPSDLIVALQAYVARQLPTEHRYKPIYETYAYEYLKRNQLYSPDYRIQEESLEASKLAAIGLDKNDNLYIFNKNKPFIKVQGQYQEAKLSGNNTIIAIDTRDGMHIIDLTGEILKSMPFKYYDIKINDDETFEAVNSFSKKVQLFDLEGNLLGEKTIDTEPKKQAANTNEIIINIGDDGYIYIYDIRRNLLNSIKNAKYKFAKILNKNEIFAIDEDDKVYLFEPIGK